MHVLQINKCCHVEHAGASALPQRWRNVATPIMASGSLGWTPSSLRYRLGARQTSPSRAIPAFARRAFAREGRFCARGPVRKENGVMAGDVVVEYLGRMPPGKVELAGDLDLPAGARGVVLFAHGSGSSRHSPRNRQVAEVFQRAGYATLLLDLLTPRKRRSINGRGSCASISTRWPAGSPGRLTGWPAGDTGPLPLAIFGGEHGCGGGPGHGRRSPGAGAAGHLPRRSPRPGRRCAGPGGRARFVDRRRRRPRGAPS